MVHGDFAGSERLIEGAVQGSFAVKLFVISNVLINYIVFYFNFSRLKNFNFTEALSVLIYVVIAIISLPNLIALKLNNVDVNALEFCLRMEIVSEGWFNSFIGQQDYKTSWKSVDLPTAGK